MPEKTRGLSRIGGFDQVFCGDSLGQLEESIRSLHK